ncbi:MAG TPA: quinoprotein dehydrogenase-associated putative ABC transporter substrate-binding protein [Polyangiaceae bacterium]|nr:quinoprotein dehydrogenase-associated putative ABC transporter substrate-binding protein [Polyangiaceae bacterium]
MTSRKSTRSRFGLLLATSLGVASVVIPNPFGAGEAADARAADENVLRVCGDPNNMPFSNEKQEGIENQIATLIGKDLGWKVEYVWWPHQRGLVKRVLDTGRCDVMLGIPKGYDLVRWTKPYYRTGYVIAYRTDRISELRSLDDPRLKTLKVGVQVNTPPHLALRQQNIINDNVVSYQLMFDSNAHPEDYPGKEVEDLIAGRIDVALVYGPIAGYFQKKKGEASLALVPIEEPNASLPFAFDISMGVRKGNDELKARLEQVIEHKHEEIRSVLESFGVPLLPLTASVPASAAGKPGAPYRDEKNKP